jgi:hypothetical protein
MAYITGKMAGICAIFRFPACADPPARSESFEELIENIEVLASSVFALPVDLHAKDLPLLCAAIRARCTWFVTGDQKDFGHLFDETIQGITVITPLRLAQLMARDHRDEGS